VDFKIDEILLSLQEGVYCLDHDHRITFWNPAAERITGFSSAEVLGTRCSDNILIHVDETGTNLCMAGCPAAATLDTGETHTTEVFLLHRNGHRVPVQVRVAPLVGKNGAITGVVELFSDISDKVAMRARIDELEKLALLDPLTQLSNRRHIDGELRAVLDEHARYGLSFGVLLLDLDDFKGVNDRYGHEAGDLALETVAATLRANARPFDLFGRWGGEEFVGVIRNVDQEGVCRVANRCRALIGATQVHLKDEVLQVTASVGATLVRPGDDADQIIRRADELMYASKREGKDRTTCDGE